MTVETTSTLSTSIRGRYKDTYMEAAKRQLVYDQLAIPVPGVSMDEAARGSSVTVPFLSGMTPGTTAISQVADVTPEILKDDDQKGTASRINSTAALGTIPFKVDMAGQERFIVNEYGNVGIGGYPNREGKFVMNKPKVMNGFVGYIKQFTDLNLNNLKPDTDRTMTGAKYFFKKKTVLRKKNSIMSAYKSRSTTVGRLTRLMTIDELAK